MQNDNHHLRTITNINQFTRSKYAHPTTWKSIRLGSFFNANKALHKLHTKYSYTNVP